MQRETGERALLKSSDTPSGTQSSGLRVLRSVAARRGGGAGHGAGRSNFAAKGLLEPRKLRAAAHLAAVGSAYRSQRCSRGGTPAQMHSNTVDEVRQRSSHNPHWLLKVQRLDIHLEIIESGGSPRFSVRFSKSGRHGFHPMLRFDSIKAMRTIEVREADALGEFRFSSVARGRVPIEILLRPQRQRVDRRILGLVGF